MSDAAAYRLAQALRDLIQEAVQEAVERERRTQPPARVLEHPKVPDEDFCLVPMVYNTCRARGITIDQPPRSPACTFVHLDSRAAKP
jgi:hypothetical protein